MKVCSVCRQCYDDSVTICTAEDQGSLTQERQGDCLIVEGYRIDSRVESVSSPELYKATHLASGKKVLIRFIVTDDFSTELENELNLVIGINHLNLARAFEFGKFAENEYYVVLEDIPGQSLRAYLKKSSPLTEIQAIKIARQIAEGLEELHKIGVTHRAVNPANTYLTNLENTDFGVKLQNYDFGGIVQKAVAKKANCIDAKTEVLRYFSPEQFTNEKIDFKSDIYSLAVVFYEMLLGRSPYHSLDPQAIANYVFNGRDVEKLHFDLRALLAHTLRESLRHRIDMRPPTTNNFVRQLRHLELIAMPHDITLQGVPFKASKPKHTINKSQSNNSKPIEKPLVAEAKFFNPEPVNFDFPKDETIEIQINEPKNEPQIEISVEKTSDIEYLEQELEGFSVLETAIQSQSESVYLESFDYEVPEPDKREVQQELNEQVADEELNVFNEFDNEQIKTNEINFVNNFDNEKVEVNEFNIIEKVEFLESSSISEDIHITNKDFNESEEHETLFDTSIEYEESISETQENNYEINDEMEVGEFNLIDEIDFPESEEVSEDIHLTNKNIHIILKDFDENVEQETYHSDSENKEPEFVEPLFINDDQSRLFESIENEEPEFINESNKDESAATQQIMNSFGSYTQTHSSKFNKTFLYIASILILTVLSGLITVNFWNSQSVDSSSGTTSSEIPSNLNDSQKNEEGVLQDNMQETADINQQDSDNTQTQESLENDIQKKDESVTQTSSGNSMENGTARKTENNKLPTIDNIKEKGIEDKKLKTSPVKEQTAKFQNKQKGDLQRKQDVEKTKPAIDKTDGKTRPRVVKDVKINN